MRELTEAETPDWARRELRAGEPLERPRQRVGAPLALWPFLLVWTLALVTVLAVFL